MPLLKQLTAKVTEKILPVDLLEKGQFQPRLEFAQVLLQELADSIKSVGLLQPIIVRPKNNSRYEIIAGERRWGAAQLAGLHEVSCKVIECDNEQALQIALIENLAQEDLNPIEKAQGIKRLIDEFHYTQEEVAKNLSASRSTVANLLRLLALTKDVRTLILKEYLTESHGKTLLSLPTEKQYFYAKEAIAKEWSTRELDRAIKHDQKRNACRQHGRQVIKICNI